VAAAAVAAAAVAPAACDGNYTYMAAMYT